MAPSEIETREELAHALTALRTNAGLSVRALARRLGTPSATVGDYCSGRHLPGPSQQELFCEMLRACGVEESDLGSWLAAVQSLRRVGDGRLRQIAAPYRGLEPFQVEDRARFFGREAATEEILTRLRDQVEGATGGLVLVVGPSGAGKSSLLRAGVQAQVDAGALDTDHGEWQTTIIAPGDRPLETLRDALADLPERPWLLIVDQLEEIFASSTEDQDRFLNELERIASPDTVVLAGMRADFYESASRVPVLLAALRAEPVLLGPMTEDELRSAIVGPARQAGAQVEAALVERLLADLEPRDGSGFAHEAGALPLLSHALLQSWQHAQGNRLTIADYRATGGLEGAVRQSAEDLYVELSDVQRALARRIFMRLVRVPEDGPAVRRRADRQELYELGDTARAEAELSAFGSEAEQVVARFVAARLLTIDVNTAEVSHEALLTAWPRLAGWLREDRAGLRLHNQLTDASRDWVTADRDPELLLRGARLQLITDWASESGHRAELTADEAALLAASQTLQLSRLRTARRRRNQMRALLAASVAFGIVAFTLAVIAVNARVSATHARDDAQSRQLALQATSLMPSDPSLAMQLAVLARRIAPTTDANSALLDASGGETPTRLLGPNGPAYLALSHDDERLAVAYSGDDRVRVYGLSSGVPRLIATIVGGPASAQVFAVALSPDGRLLAAGGTNQQVGVWRLASPAHPTQIATLGRLAGTVYGLSFSADGRQLAAVDAGRTIDLWSVSGEDRLQPATALAAPPDASLHAVQFDPTGHLLAAAGANGQIVVWNQTGLDALPAVTSAPGGVALTALSFSPDGRTLAAGGEGKPVYLWTLHDGGPPTAIAPLHGFSIWVDSLAFSPDGRYLAAGGSDNSLRIWSASTWTPLAKLAHPAPVTGEVFAPHGTQLLSIDSTGTLRVWSFPPPSTWLAPGNIFGVDYANNGNELAVISGGHAGNAQLWRTTNPSDPTLIANVAAPASFGAVAGAGALTDNGKLLAVANARAQVQLIDVTNPLTPQPVGPVLTGATPHIEQMSFDPTGRLLAAGDDAGQIKLWNTADPAHPVAEPTLRLSGPAQIMLGVAFSPNGQLLASASTNGHVLLWNVAAPSHPTLTATLGRFNGYAYTVAFTPDGHTLIAGGGDRTVRLWNISNPTRPQALVPPLTGPTSSLYDVAVSPDGSLAAAAATDGSLWLWNIQQPATPTLLATLTASSTSLFAVSFQPHSDTMITSGADEQLHLFNDNPSRLAVTICKLAGTPLTRAEWSEYVQTAQYAPPCR